MKPLYAMKNSFFAITLNRPEHSLLSGFRWVALSAAAAMALHSSAAPARPEAQAIELFNGRDLTGWYSYLEKIGRDEDPHGNFKVENGEIHVLGQDFGYLATKNSYENYRLKVEFKWGTRQFAPRATGKRDSGVLYHFLEGEPDKVWPNSLECQVQEGDTGDIWCIGTADVVSADPQEYSWGQKHVLRTADHERPHGEWNTVEVVVDGDRIEHWVNGQLVAQGDRANVRRGRILLQSEGAEIFFRKVELTPR